MLFLSPSYIHCPSSGPVYFANSLIGSQHVEWNKPPTGMFSRSSLKRFTAASVYKTSIWMPLLSRNATVSGQTCNRSQIPLESTTALAPCSINS